MHTIVLKRAYEPYASTDGLRILVDRLWPRGVTKSAAHIDLWLKEIAPTTDLRKWFGHDPSRWDEFQVRYRDELEHNPEPVEHILECARKGSVTLVFSARDVEHNDAVVLKSYLESLAKRVRRKPRGG
ncbi:MAG: DUF488 domain-containing protein [Lysobacteraceae bacterium]